MGAGTVCLMGARAAWKGPFVSAQLLKQVIALAHKHPQWWQQGRFRGMPAPEVINTQCRSSVILPDFLGVKFGIHNGKEYLPLEVTEEMFGRHLWEFSATTKVRTQGMYTPLPGFCAQFPEPERTLWH